MLVKHLKTFLVTCLLLVSSVNLVYSEPLVNSVFESILPILKQQTQVPILLPSKIPTEEVVKLEEMSYKLQAFIDKIDLFSYQVLLGYGDNCNGGNACRYGYVSGKLKTPITLPLQEEYEVDTSYYPLRSPEPAGFILLADKKTKAYFLPYTCAAFCSDSSLAWDYQDSRYTVSVKGGTSKDLLTIANSMTKQ